MKKIYFFVFLLSTLYSVKLKCQDEIEFFMLEKAITHHLNYSSDFVNHHPSTQETSNRTVTCGQDTLQYGRAKADLTDGMLAGVGLSGPFTAAGQRYEVPEGASVEVTGFALFARILNADAPVRCAIYEADMSGLPMGEALATTDIVVTSIDSISYINFDTPVTVTSNFVLTTELLSATPLAVNTNNGMAGAGQGEKLALLLFQGNWVVAETTGPPGAFNFDFIMEPFVNYDITAGVSSDVANNTVYADSNYSFTANHSSLVNSRFFNKVAFDQYFSDSTLSATTWGFGDGTPIESGDAVTHVFSDDASSYTVIATAIMEGYTTTCEDILELTVSVNTPSVFTCGQDTLQYGRAKADLTDGMLAVVGLSGPFTAAGQRYEVPEGASVEVTGFALFARILNADAPVRCAIYEADMSGLPMGEALATTDIVVTSIDSISYINFDTPVTVTSNFVLTTELLSATPLAVNTNNGMAGAGQGEKLALLLFQGNWVVAETTGPPGAFNFDFIMEPFVNYDITAGMSSDVANNTVYADSNYSFTANHSSLVNSRFFNKVAFDQYFSDSTLSATTWSFGDGTPIESGDAVTHVFSDDASSYTVMATAIMEGYTTTCEDILEIIVSVNTPSVFTCGQDTLQYGRAKADLTDGMLAGVGLSGPFTAAGQRYEVPEGASVEVSGFALFARILNADAPVRCAIYEADMSGLPMGEALATTDIVVTSIDSISYINFDTPVTMTSDFVLTTELLSATPLAVNTNNGMMAAGQGEKLALLLFQGNWVVAETTGPPGAFNFDFIMEPFVNYDITAGMSSDVPNNTVYADSNYSFTANHSSLVNSRFFNKVAFDQYFSDSTLSATTWSFGDGTPIESGDAVTHVFSDDASSYTVMATAIMEGYTTTCEDILETTYDVEAVSHTIDNLLDTPIIISPNPSSGYSQIEFNLKQASEVNIAIYNLNGQQVKKYNFSNLKESKIEMDLSNQVSGLYFIKIEIKGLVSVKKLIIQ